MLARISFLSRPLLSYRALSSNPGLAARSFSDHSEAQASPNNIASKNRPNPYPTHRPRQTPSPVRRQTERRQTSFESLVREANSVFTPTPSLELSQFRQLVAAKKSMDAWPVYAKLLDQEPCVLTMADHLNYFNILRSTKKRGDFVAMENIFNFLEDNQFDIPVPVYDLMMRNAVPVSAELTDKYFDKMVAKHGPSARTDLSISVRMNAYRGTAKNYQKVIELANEAESLGITTHRLKPFLMDAYYNLGDKDAALGIYNSYLANETGTMNISRTYGWMAKTLLNEGNVEEARAVLAKVASFRTEPCHVVMIAQCRLAILDNNFHNAQELILHLVHQASPEIYTNVASDLVSAFLAAGEFSLLEEYLVAFNKAHKNVNRMRLLPYVKVLEFHGNTTNPGALGAEEVGRIFDMIPSGGKYRSKQVLSTVITAFANLGEMSRARGLLTRAHESGFSTEDLVADPALIENLKAPEVPVTCALETPSESPSVTEAAKPAAAPSMAVDPALQAAAKPLNEQVLAV